MIKKVKYEDCKLIEICDKLLTNLIIEDAKYDNNYKANVKLNSIKEDLNDTNNYIYVFIENDIVCGFIFGKISESKMYKDKVGKILFLYVLKEYRNNKIATKLINQIKKDFINNHIKYLDINVFYKNEIANNLYKKLGFNNYISNLRCEISL